MDYKLINNTNPHMEIPSISPPFEYAVTQPLCNQMQGLRAECFFVAYNCVLAENNFPQFIKV